MTLQQLQRVVTVVAVLCMAAGCASPDHDRTVSSESPAANRQPASPTPESTARGDAHAQRQSTGLSRETAAAVATTGVEATGESAQQPAAEPKIATPFPGVRVWVNGHHVEFDGIVCIDAGCLEFIACSPQTKEHEALVVFEQQPSNLHAALLLAGFKPGHPGRWTYENEQFELVPPSGTKLQIDVRYTTPDGEQHTHSMCRWVHDHLGRQDFPCKPWVFGGSQFATNLPSMGPGEHYVADMTGSIIGLATFGDEMIGYSTVISHDSSVQAPEWEAYTERLPPIGTAVTVIITPFE